jgi:ER membrane protein SH3
VNEWPGNSERFDAHPAFTILTAGSWSREQRGCVYSSSVRVKRSFLSRSLSERPSGSNSGNRDQTSTTLTSTRLSAVRHFYGYSRLYYRIRHFHPSWCVLYHAFTRIYSHHPTSGLLFTHWIADSLTLWRAPVTDAHLWVAARYYHVLTKGAPGVSYVVAATAILGALTILWSFREGRADNLMFDGGSICKKPFYF